MNVRFVLRISLAIACVLPAPSGLAQETPAIPPSLDPAFWGRANHPYTLKLIQTTTGINGNDAPQMHVAMNVYRDSVGRVREESFYDNGGPSAVSIRDPGKNTSTFLHILQKSAVVLAVPRASVPPPGKGWTVERLPVRYIEGFPAEGFRFTRTIAAASAGIGTPVTVVEEDWISSQLSVVLEQTIHDPRSGITTKTVSQFKQIEPDPTLFKVDLSGYSIQQVGSQAQ